MTKGERYVAYAAAVMSGFASRGMDARSEARIRAVEAHTIAEAMLETEPDWIEDENNKGFVPGSTV